MGSSKNYRTIVALSTFGYSLLAIEILTLLLFAIFLRIKLPTSPPSPLETEHLLAFLCTNLLTLVGFSIFLSFGHNHQFTPLSFTLLTTTISLQIYLLFYPFWLRIMNGFHLYPISIELDLELLIRAARSGLGAVVGLTAVAGRVTPKDILKLVGVFIVGYSFNQVLVQHKVEALDPGGTTVIFAYAACFALMVSFILGKKVTPVHFIEESYKSAGFAMIGTVVLWVAWPLFNCGLYPTTDFQVTLILTNTLYAMIGSCMAMGMLSGLYKEGLTMLSLHRSTIVGAVAVGCSVHLIYHPAVALSLGFISGAVAFLSLRHLQGRLQMGCGLLDTSGVVSFGLFSSVVGGLASCLLLVVYFYHAVDQNVISATSQNGIFGPFIDLNTRAGWQVGALLVSMGMGLLMGLVAGMLVILDYRESADCFYKDDWHFDVNADEEQGQLQYELQEVARTKDSSSRMQVPESLERFNGQHEGETEPNEARGKKKKKFRTRYEM